MPFNVNYVLVPNKKINQYLNFWFQYKFNPFNANVKNMDNYIVD